MKKVIISLLSVLAIAFAFVGCNEASINSGSTVTDSEVADTEVVVDPTTDITEETVNELGISSYLGTPPARPGV